MKFQDYVDAIILDKTKRCVQTVIRSYQHNVFPEDVDKIAISARDDKRVRLVFVVNCVVNCSKLWLVIVVKL